MIAELHLKNFRGFEDHHVPLKAFTIIVGRNNAGKSTIAEALRLVSIVVSRFKGKLGDIPSRWEFPRNRRGPHPFKNLEINLDSVFHRYGEPPAVIQAKFTTGEIVEVSITRDEIVARRLRSRRSSTFEPGLSRVSLLPQVAPVAKEERLLIEDYVKGALSSALAPMHFRNQFASRWTHKDDRLSVVPGKEVFSRISRLVQETYKVSISGLLVANNIYETELPSEMREVLSSIERCDPFPERTFH